MSEMDRIAIDLPQSVVTGLDSAAHADGKSRADLIREILDRFLERKGFPWPLPTGDR